MRGGRAHREFLRVEAKNIKSGHTGNGVPGCAFLMKELHDDADKIMSF
jgi:hypothetical protein